MSETRASRPPQRAPCDRRGPRALGRRRRTGRFPEGTKTAADAAAAIGCDVGQIVKSLIFAVDGEVVLAYVSGANQLDEAKLAAAAGGTHVPRVDADVVRRATGFPIGGVPPFGHATALPVFVDPDLLQYDVVWAAAGTWNDVFALTPADLVRASGGHGRRPQALTGPSTERRPSTDVGAAGVRIRTAARYSANGIRPRRAGRGGGRSGPSASTSGSMAMKSALAAGDDRARRRRRSPNSPSCTSCGRRAGAAAPRHSSGTCSGVALVADGELAGERRLLDDVEHEAEHVVEQRRRRCRRGTGPARPRGRSRA